MMLCLAPLLLTGYLFTVETSWHHTQNVNAPYVEVQTCDKGLGAHVKASAAGLYAGGLHYGFRLIDGENFSLTFQPKAGISYADHPMYELPMRTQFEVGAGLLAGYKDYRLGLEYWHLSDAGLRSPNIGMDMIGLTVGYSF